MMEYNLTEKYNILLKKVLYLQELIKDDPEIIYQSSQKRTYE